MSMLTQILQKPCRTEILLRTMQNPSLQYAKTFATCNHSFMGKGIWKKKLHGFFKIHCRKMAINNNHNTETEPYDFPVPSQSSQLQKNKKKVRRKWKSHKNEKTNPPSSSTPCYGSSFFKTLLLLVWFPFFSIPVFFIIIAFLPGYQRIHIIKVLKKGWLLNIILKTHNRADFLLLLQFWNMNFKCFSSCS